MRLLSLGFLILFTPTLTHAAVSVSEVAWMGTTESYLCNWVELHNAGDAAVDVADWSLYIDDTERVFADGTGATTVIPAGEYWLLKRETNTCPDPVPDVDGWLLTLGNLPNDGATLRLVRSDGTTADQIAGGEEWSNLGGDNDTKETAQYTEAGWVTAPPTPGMEPESASEREASRSTNATTSDDTDSDSEASTTQTREQGSSDGRAVRLTVPDIDLELAVSAPETGYVHQPVRFTAEPSGLGDNWLRSLRYQWNFGDTHTARGKSTTHTFAYPGTYVVTVRAEYQHHAQVARHEITILPVPLALGRDDDGNVQVHNEARYEIDLSGYELVGAQSVTVPPRTILLPKSTLTVTKERLEPAASGLVVVRDRAGERVASNFASLAVDRGSASTHRAAVETPNPNTVAIPAAPPAAPTSPAASDRSFGFASPQVAGTSTTTATGTDSAMTVAATTSATTVSPEAATTTSAGTVTDVVRTYWPTATLVILLLVVAGVLLRRPPASARETDAL